MFNVQVERAKDGEGEGEVQSVSSLSSSSESSSDPSALKTYDADSIDLHLEQASKKKQFIKAHKHKSSYNLSSSKFSKGEQNLSQLGLNESNPEKFR